MQHGRHCVLFSSCKLLPGIHSANRYKQYILQTMLMFCYDMLWFVTGSFYQHHSTLQQFYNEHDGISNHKPHDCLLKRLFILRLKKTSKLYITGLCEGNSSVTSEFPAQKASNRENVTICWCHHGITSVWLWQAGGCQESNSSKYTSKQIKWIKWN